ncbi:hypothetical protein niasHT_002408 [Heterodera trifolii]|uniref:Ankyrin repeat protein n=1 Tax=Heterodera trifolii TaxID=157864 RepID=A0ABD2LM66_9BILA
MEDEDAMKWRKMKVRNAFICPALRADTEHPTVVADVDNFETLTLRFFDLINDGNIQQLRVLIDSLDADELNILLRWTVDPVERDNTRSRSALWSAFLRQHTEIVDLLLEKGADPNEPVADQVNNINTNMTPLFLAVRHANLPLCRVLVARGANVDLGTDFATTPLMIACRRSQTEIVTFLVENGANINLQNGDGATALMYACNKGNVDIVRLLLSHGANVELTDFEGYFLLTDAAFGGSLEVCRLLVEEWAADVNQQTIQERYTALIFAASRGHLAIVNFLVEHGADLQHVDVDGHSALMWAVKKGKIEMARHLVAIGADINQRNMEGKRAQDFAEESGNAEMVAIFRTTAPDNGRRHAAEGTDGQQNEQQQINVSALRPIRTEFGTAHCTRWAKPSDREQNSLQNGLWMGYMTIHRRRFADGQFADKTFRRPTIRR